MPDLPYNVAYGGAKANYARLVIPDVLPDARQVLYLDADLIILDDLKPLLRTQLSNGQPLGAVRDPVNPTLGLGRALPGWQHLGLSPQREYFNSGVLLLDLATCGRDGVFERAWRAVSENPQMLRMWDQDALNLAAADNWHRLPARWNTAPLSALSRTPWIRYRAESLVPLADLIRAEDDAAIMHYITPSKPWRNLLPDGRPNAVYQRHFATVRSAEKHL
jgi:lipopolysaccharide biosynthesis glycosyltransferase